MSSEQAHERIGPTAHYTAYVWKELGLPYAELFATRKGAALYWSFFAAGEWLTRVGDRTPSMRAFLEYRHRLIDAVVLGARPDRLIELGAGLTRRSVTWAVDHGVDAFDLDLPAMIDVRRSILVRGPAVVREALDRTLHLVACDVTGPDVGEVLDRALAGAERPLLVAEGLVSYFDRSTRLALFAAVAAALRRAGGGRFVVDLHTRVDQAKFGHSADVLRFALRTLTRRRQALDPFETRDEVRRGFEAAGFDDCRLEEPSRYLHVQPRLAHVRSPALVYSGTVNPGRARTA